ncbi:MFS transporter [Nocardia sp. NPDC057227]|uniref:MFS transporter n=1 Tax=Nocardia sp. NPDC057227 TaxID=3346056 RepID=UPI00363D7D6D
MGREFEWLWVAYTISACGTWLAFDAFAVLAVRALDAGPGAVSLLAAAGPAAGALLALPLGPVVEFRRKRPVLVAMDLLRGAVLLSVPAGYALGVLGFAQLLVVAIVVGTADLTFTAASGAYLKSLVRPELLLRANGRFEATTWTAALFGPPLGGVAVGLCGPAVTVLANAVSFLLSAAALRGAGTAERPPVRAGGARLRAADLLAGWWQLLTDPLLRPLLGNVVLVNGLIMATAPLLAVLMLGPLGFTPWQYGLAFALPCAGGLLGARLARPLAARFGQRRVLLGAGVARVCWPIGLVFVGPGTGGLLLVTAVQSGLVLSSAVFTPIVATVRLNALPAAVVTPSLAAWSVGTKGGTAALIALAGLVAAVTDARTALGVAGVLLLGTPLLLLPVSRAGRAAPAALPSAPPVPRPGAAVPDPPSPR